MRENMMQQFEQKAARRAKAYRAVAFDVFDTLLKRDVNRPADLFFFMEQTGRAAAGFAADRHAAEARARAAHSGEVTLQEIYAQPELRGADPAAETRAELQAATPNPALLRLARACHARGQKVYAVSDMYLPAEQISAMLAKCGYDFLDGVFVSCEQGVQKRSGGLFRVFLQQTGLKPNDVLFFGDDFRADVLGAALAGVRSILLPKPAASAYAPQGQPPLAGALRVFLHNRTGEMPQPQALGFALLGPLAVAFATWLHGQAAAQPGAKVVFLARDMALVRQVYQALYPDAPVPGYLKVSRRSLCPALLQCPMTEENLALLADALPRQCLRASEIAGYCGFAQGDTLPGVAPSALFDLRRRPLEKPVIDCLRALAAASKMAAGEPVRRQAELARAYLAEELPAGTPVMLVDIGSGGTTQRILEKLTGAFYQGRYLACDERLHRALPKARAQAFLFDGQPADLWYWAGQPMLELLLSEPCPATVGYTAAGQKVRPLLGERMEQPLILPLQDGALRFVIEWKNSYLGEQIIPPQLACGPYLQLVRAPHKVHARLLGGLLVEDGGVYPLAAPQKFGIYCRHPGALRADFAKARWKTAFCKLLLPLPLPYDRLYAALKRRTAKK